MLYIRKSFKANWLLLFILVVAVLILSYRIDKPFWGHHDWNNAYFGNIARNYTRYDLVSIKLGQVISSLNTPFNQLVFHTHHPPLLPLSLALSYLLFGIGEIPTRVVPTIYSLGSLAVLYFLLREIFNKRVAFLSLIFWIITPLYIYFGKLAVHEPLVVFFLLLAFWRYRVWQKQRTVGNYSILVAVIFAGAMSGWPGHYIPLVINFYHFWETKKGDKSVLSLLLIPIITFLLVLFQNQLLTGSPFGGNLLENYRFRSTPVGWFRFLRQELVYLSVYITKPVLATSMLGLLLAIRDRKSLFMVTFLIFGLIHPLLFQEAAFRHDYLIYGLLPFFAVSSGYFILALAGLSNRAAVFVGLATIFLSSLQTHRFTAELINSNRFKDGVIIGEYIFGNTFPSDKILLIIPDNLEFEGWHTTFYANRNLEVSRESGAGDYAPGKYSVIVNYSPSGGAHLARPKEDRDRGNLQSF